MEPTSLFSNPINLKTNIQGGSERFICKTYILWRTILILIVFLMIYNNFFENIINVLLLRSLVQLLNELLWLNFPSFTSLKGDPGVFDSYKSPKYRFPD